MMFEVDAGLEAGLEGFVVDRSGSRSRRMPMESSAMASVTSV
jgi:hypothetical protein